MDRVSAPEDLSAEREWHNSATLHGVSPNKVATADESLAKLGETTELVHRCDLPSDDGRNVFAIESPSLIDRPDIDTAMLDALRRATVSDHGFPVLGWAAPVRGQYRDHYRDQGRDQLGVARRREHEAGSMQVAPVRSRPFDVDMVAAMLEALRWAMASEPESPGG